jgi:hypothetical protein
MLHEYQHSQEDNDRGDDNGVKVENTQSCYYSLACRQLIFQHPDSCALCFLKFFTNSEKLDSSIDEEGDQQ